MYTVLSGHRFTPRPRPAERQLELPPLRRSEAPSERATPKDPQRELPPKDPSERTSERTTPKTIEETTPQAFSETPPSLQENATVAMHSEGSVGPGRLGLEVDEVHLAVS